MSSVNEPSAAEVDSAITSRRMRSGSRTSCTRTPGIPRCCRRWSSASTQVTVPKPPGTARPSMR
ncbi:MAG: hypothetical protein EBQ99_00975 [Planctomycetes bacterium]|nr:hypothetical protein [Planctomycetota bacterium]